MDGQQLIKFATFLFLTSFEDEYRLQFEHVLQAHVVFSFALL